METILPSNCRFKEDKFGIKEIFTDHQFFCFCTIAWTSKNYSSDTVMSKLKINQTRGSGLGVAVESMGLISYQRAYRQVISTGENTTASVTYPLMMAVVHVTKGKVTVRNYC